MGKEVTEEEEIEKAKLLGCYIYQPDMSTMRELFTTLRSKLDAAITLFSASNTEEISDKIIQQKHEAKVELTSELSKQIRLKEERLSDPTSDNAKLFRFGTEDNHVIMEEKENKAYFKTKNFSGTIVVERDNSIPASQDILVFELDESGESKLVAAVFGEYGESHLGDIDMYKQFAREKQAIQAKGLVAHKADVKKIVQSEKNSSEEIDAATKAEARKIVNGGQAIIQDNGVMNSQGQRVSHSPEIQPVPQKGVEQGVASHSAGIELGQKAEENYLEKPERIAPVENTKSVSQNLENSKINLPSSESKVTNDLQVHDKANIISTGQLAVKDAAQAVGEKLSNLVTVGKAASEINAPGSTPRSPTSDTGIAK